LGKALLGKKEGDTVTVKVNDDYSYDVVIRKIDESTDDAEDEIKSF
jgi:transcription elongation factor GreA